MLRSVGRITLYPFNYKERLFYDFTSADRTSAGFLESFPLAEEKSALPADRVFHDKMALTFIEGLSEVFEMFAYLFLRDPDLARYLFCRKLVVLKQGQYLPADRLPPRNRNKGLLSFLHRRSIH